MKRKGLIFIISAPSGTGKTTVIKNFLKSHRHDFVLSVSVTTRAPRKNEKDGEDYYFFSREKFKKYIKQGKFLEYAKVLDNYYGTLKSTVLNSIKKGLNVIMDIDVQGAAKIKRKISDCITIFLRPPSLNELKKRLFKRRTESVEEAKKRINLAKKELKEQEKYDYILTNKNINDVVETLEAIYKYEKFKREYIK
jgi:guanylate kinase